MISSVKIQKEKESKELTEGNWQKDWMVKSFCFAASWGVEGHTQCPVHCLKSLGEQKQQLSKLYGNLSRADKTEMELKAECHSLTEAKLPTALGIFSMVHSVASLISLEQAHDPMTSESVETFLEQYRLNRRFEVSEKLLSMKCAQSTVIAIIGLRTQNSV